MNTLAALLSKLQVKDINPEVKALCAIIDAQRFHLDGEIASHERQIKALEHKVQRINEKLTRTDSE